MTTTLQIALPAQENRFIGEAAKYLEHPGFLMRAANLLGQPLEVIGRRLPQSWQHFLHVGRYHFGLRVLERKYGRETIQEAYRTASK